MAGDVRVKVGADTTQLTTGLKTASASVESFAGKTNVAGSAMSRLKTSMAATTVAAQKAMAGIKGAFGGLGGLLVGGAVVGGLRSLMNDMDRVGKLATRFDTSAESIQRVSVAAQIAGTDVEAVANAMTKAGIAASKAATQGGSVADLFKRAGINAQSFANANIDEKLLMVAEAYRAAGNDASKTNAIIEIMGSRAGANLIPLISNLEGLKAEMAGVAVTTDATVRRIEAANDTLTRTTNTLKVYFAEAVGFFVGINERIGTMLAAMESDPFSFTPNPYAGATLKEIEEIERRTKAIELLRSRDGITDATEETIQREIKAIKEREAAKRKDQEVTTPTIAAGSKEDPAAAAQKYADEVQKISQEARVQMARNRELDAQDAARKAREVAKAKKDAEIEAMGEKVDAADEKMRRLSSTENAMPQADILRRIGGGFANSNYGQLSREAMLISKQVDYASKQLDELKKIVTELRKSDPLGGITT